MAVTEKKRFVLQMGAGIVRGFFIAVLLIVVVGLLYHRPLAEAAVYHGIVQRTGLQIEIGDIHFDFEQGAFRVEELKLLNPRGFADPYMAEIHEAYLDFDARSFIMGNGRLEELIIHIGKLWVIRNHEDKLNVHAWKGKGGDVTLDRFVLIIDEIIYKDYFISREPITQHLPVHIHNEYRDIDGFDELGDIIGYRALGNVVFRRLIPLNPARFIQSNVFDPITVANKVVSETIGAVGETVTGTAGAVVEGVQDTARRLLDVITSPFARDSG